jgi:NitT/TauT family transport system substrate-binding protein
MMAATAGGAVLSACGPAAPASPVPATAAPPAVAPSPAAKASAAPSPAVPSPAALASAAPSAVVKTLTKPAAITPVSQVMSWFAESAHGGQFAALINGDYEKQNLKMTNEQGGPGVSVVPLVASGKYTIGMFTADQLLLARQEGIPLVGVYANFQSIVNGLMYHQSNPVKDFAGLNGRRVYVAATANFWPVLVKKYKLDNVTQMTYNGQLATFLADPMAVFQCFVSEEPLAAKKQGADVGYLRIVDSGYNPYQGVMGTTEQTIKEKPEMVQAYVTATLAGWKTYLQDPKPTLEAIKGVNKDYNTELGAQSAEVERPMVLGQANEPKAMGTMIEPRFKELHDQLRDVGILKADIDYKAVFNSTFINAAVSAAG